MTVEFLREETDCTEMELFVSAPQSLHFSNNDTQKFYIIILLADIGETWWNGTTQLLHCCCIERRKLLSSTLMYFRVTFTDLFELFTTSQ